MLELFSETSLTMFETAFEWDRNDIKIQLSIVQLAYEKSDKDRLRKIKVLSARSYLLKTLLSKLLGGSDNFC